jgi:hypothetical protein
VLASYVIPAVIAWVVLGILVNLLPLSAIALVVIAVYGVCYGALEVSGRARPAPPGSGWQVPSEWVRGVSRRRRSLVWGSLLGPGFATRNPYAGFWLLPLAVAAVGSIGYGVLLAAAVGAAHSTGRALGLLRDVRSAEAFDYFQSALRSVYWRVADGFALLAVAAASSLTYAYRL